MVSLGCRSTVAISPASTAANARGRSTVRAPRRVRNARRALPSTRCRDPASRAIPAPRRTRITCGWTGSISWASAPTCRLRPATNRIRCTRWSAARSSSCVSLIRWVFRQGSRRPYRRLEGRLEGPRIMGYLGQSHAVSHRRHRRAGTGRPGRHTRDAVEPARRRIPAASRPARSLSDPDATSNSI